MPVSSKYVMLFVFVSSLILYVAGVATGWYIGQIYYKSSSEKLNQLESQMRDLRMIPKSTDLCSYAEARYYMILSSLKYFPLPYRLESEDVPEDVLDQYMSVESEAYLTGQVLGSSCNTKPRLIVYFFKRSRPESVEAGKILDKARNDFVVLSFPVDTNSTVVKPLQTYLNISNYPAVHLCGKTLYWPFNSSQVQEAEKLCG